MPAVAHFLTPPSAYPIMEAVALTKVDLAVTPRPTVPAQAAVMEPYATPPWITLIATKGLATM